MFFFHDWCNVIFQGGGSWLGGGVRLWGAAFGDVGVSLFVASPACGDVGRSFLAQCDFFPFECCVSRISNVFSHVAVIFWVVFFECFSFNISENFS